MTHWFDSLCKELAQESSVSRRGAIGGAFAGMLATSWVGRATAQTSKSNATPGACTRQASAGKPSNMKVSLSRSGLTYELTRTVDTDGNGTSTTLVRQGKDPVLTVTTTLPKSGTVKTVVAYGTAISGVKSVTLEAIDRKTFKGSADGRTFTAKLGGPGTVAAQFDDGREAPKPRIESALESQILSLRNDVYAALKSCTAVATPRTATPKKVEKKAAGIPRGGASDPGYSPGYTYPAGETANSPSCTNCYNNCTSTCCDITGACSAGSWFTDVVSLGATLAADEVCNYGCFGVCNLPGGGCYPVACGGPWEACGSGDTCAVAGMCCDTSDPSEAGVACGGICCGPGVTSCASDGNCGCPSGMGICGSQCCESGASCCGGNACCPKGSKCCGSTCVADNESCCGSSVCVQGETCQKGPKGDQCCIGPLNASGDCCGLNIACGSTCCQSGTSLCVKGHCCPSGQACGDVCCPSGSSCSDAKKGTCGKVCPPGVASCNGQCCPAASDKNGAIVCCYPQVQDVAPFNNSSYGCHHNFACIPPAPK